MRQERRSDERNGHQRIGQQGGQVAHPVLGEDRPAAGEAWEQDPRIDGILEARQAAKQARDFAEADRIRDALKAEGVEIVDTPQGPRWRRGKPT